MAIDINTTILFDTIFSWPTIEIIDELNGCFKFNFSDLYIYVHFKGFTSTACMTVGPLIGGKIMSAGNMTALKALKIIFTIQVPKKYIHLITAVNTLIFTCLIV